MQVKACCCTEDSWCPSGSLTVEVSGKAELILSLPISDLDCINDVDEGAMGGQGMAWELLAVSGIKALQDEQHNSDFEDLMCSMTMDVRAEKMAEASLKMVKQVLANS